VVTAVGHSLGCYPQVSQDARQGCSYGDVSYYSYSTNIQEDLVMKLKRTKRKQCHKVGYSTAAKARQALKDFGKARGSIRFYKCNYHAEDMWHLSSHTS